MFQKITTIYECLYKDLIRYNIERLKKPYVVESKISPVGDRYYAAGKISENFFFCKLLLNLYKNIDCTVLGYNLNFRK